MKSGCKTGVGLVLVRFPRNRCVTTLLLVSLGLGCSSSKPKLIAVIPRTTGTGLWEPEHLGAEIAAAKADTRIYWNAPNREDDIEGQIALINQVDSSRFSGLILSPSHALALISPVRRALDRGVPTIVLGSPLPLPAENGLHYVLNDEDLGGQLAADRIATLTNGHGTVLVLGVNPDIAGIMERARSFERFLSQRYPGIRVVKRRGTFNALREQQSAQQALREIPEATAIVALMWSSTRAAISVLKQDPRHSSVKVIGFDPDGSALFFDTPILDSVVVEDTRTMAQRAVEIIELVNRGRLAPQKVILSPTLVTRENLNEDSIRKLIDLAPASYNWDRSRIP